ncbi:ERMES complex subunit, partial [Entomortierella beljakovae]
NKPAVIVDHITVKELDMGTQPPELEMLEMGELSMERFRGIFKLTYNGDAHIVLQTKVQANPMNVKKTLNPSYTRPGVLAADQPLVLPMLLRISDFKLRGIIVLVVDQIKGITLVFKNDPLESVLVSSTFDNISFIQRFLQSEIEKQLKNLFQEDLPTAIHNLSQQFTKKPDDVSRQHSHDDQSHSRAGIYDGGLGTPMVSRNPSRRSSTMPTAKRAPGKTNSEPDLNAGIHYDEDGLKPVRKPASATIRSESPDIDARRNPHTEYNGDSETDLLQESLKHSDDYPAQRRSSKTSSRRSSFTDRYNPGMSIVQEKTNTRDNYIQHSLGIAESHHLANQFANLINSNQTISPRPQNMEHFAFRSVPPKRPTSVQYYGQGSGLRSQTYGGKTGSMSLNNGETSKGGIGAHSTGNIIGHTTQHKEAGGHGNGSPRSTHRRLQGRVGIRRYGMQMGGGGGPRELSDYDSDEYNDANEALSESEYVYVERHPRPSIDSDGHLNGSTMAKATPPSSVASLQTIDGSLSVSPPGQSPNSQSLLNRRRPSNHQSPASLLEHSRKDGGTRGESRSTSSKQTLSEEDVLHREMAAMQLNGKLSSSSSSSSRSPFATPNTASPSIGTAYATSGLLSPPNGYSMKMPPSGVTTARSFSNTQRPSPTSSRHAPPEALKRDKRNSSILSSRRMSSVGIGLGVLSKEGDRKASPSISSENDQKISRSSRPSLYQGKPISTRSGWFEPDST